MRLRYVTQGYEPERSKNHGPVDLNLRHVLQAFVAPNTFVQSAK